MLLRVKFSLKRSNCLFSSVSSVSSSSTNSFNEETTNITGYHVPVMLKECLEYLDVKVSNS